MCPVCYRVFNHQSGVERCFGKHNERCGKCVEKCHSLSDYIVIHLIQDQTSLFQQEGRRLNITQKRQEISNCLGNNDMNVTSEQMERLNDFNFDISDPGLEDYESNDGL